MSIDKATLDQFVVGGRKYQTGMHIGQASATRMPIDKRVDDLAGVVNGLLGQVAQAVTMDDKLTEQAAERIANADIVKVNDAFKMIDASKTDTSNRDDLIQEASQFYTKTRQTFKDPNVQAKYDEMYRKGTEGIVTNYVASWNKEQYQIDKKTRTDKFVTNVASLGHFYTADMMSEDKKKMSDIFTPEEIDKAASMSTADSFESAWKGQFVHFAYGRNVFTKEGNVNYADASKTFNEYFSTFGTMDDNGVITYNDGISTDAKQRVAASWQQFIGALPKKNGKVYNELYESWNKNITKALPTIDNGFATVDDIDRTINTLNSQAKEVIDTGIPLTDKQHGAMKYNLNELDSLKMKRHQADDLWSNNPDLAVSVMNGGHINPEITGFSFDVSPEYMRNVARSHVKVQEYAVEGTEVGSPEYYTELGKLVNIADTRRVNSPYIDRLKDRLTGQAGFTSLDDAKAAIATMAFLQTNGGYTSSQTVQNGIFRHVAEMTLADTNISDDKKLGILNSRLASTRTGVFSRVNDAQVRSTYYKGMEQATDPWFSANTHISAETLDAVVSMNAASGVVADSPDQASDLIKENTVRLGGFGASLAESWNPFSDKDASLAIKLRDRDGAYLTQKSYSDGLDQIVEEYNTQHPEATIDVTDVFVDSKYLGGKGRDESAWLLYAPDPANPRAKGLFIGDFNGDQIIQKAAVKRGNDREVPEDRVEVPPSSNPRAARKAFSKPDNLQVKEPFETVNIGQKGKLLQSVGRAEGGYQNMKEDKGNYYKGRLIGTNHGISAPQLAQYLGRTPTVDDMKNLTQSQADDILWGNYFTDYSYDALPKDVQEIVFHASVLSPSNAVRAVQKLVGVKVDGKVGKKTIAAMKKANFTKEDFKNLYLERLKRGKSWKDFGKGWTNRFEKLANQ